MVHYLGMIYENTEEKNRRKGMIHMKGTKSSWVCIVLILAGIVLGGLIGSIFPDSFLSYGQNFGLLDPVVLDLGVLVLTFGLSIKITISSIIGIIIGIIIYRFL